MDFVTSIEQIRHNIIYFDNLKTSQSPGEAAQYASMMKKGICFLTLHHEGRIMYAPSRFAGYANNDLTKHNDNKEKRGRDTNKAIEKILNTTPFSDDRYEGKFAHFCKQHRIAVTDKGVTGQKRKFWPAIGAGQGLLDDLLTIVGDEDSNTTRQALIEARIGQGAFRSSLVQYWGGSCAVTGCSNLSVLKASHIKPWARCTNQERLDKFNGLLLSPNLDSTFDAGLITFTNRGLIQISGRLSREDQVKLNVHANLRIRLEDSHIPYMRYHRTHIFMG